jgi:hypothetical protein
MTEVLRALKVGGFIRWLKKADVNWLGVIVTYFGINLSWLGVTFEPLMEALASVAHYVGDMLHAHHLYIFYTSLF